MIPSKTTNPLKIKGIVLILQLLNYYTHIWTSVEWEKKKLYFKTTQKSLTDAYLLVFKLMKLSVIQLLLLQIVYQNF